MIGSASSVVRQDNGAIISEVIVKGLGSPISSRHSLEDLGKSLPLVVLMRVKLPH